MIEDTAANVFVSHSKYRVLYGDTDSMRIVYNGHYFRFFEQARGEYLRARNLPYLEVEAKGLATPLTEAYAHYYSSFRYDDLIEMDCWISQIKKASFRFEYRLYLAENPDETKVSGHTVHATIDMASGRVVKIPAWLLDVL